MPDILTWLRELLSQGNFEPGSRAPGYENKETPESRARREKYMQQIEEANGIKLSREGDIELPPEKPIRRRPQLPKRPSTD